MFICLHWLKLTVCANKVSFTAGRELFYLKFDEELLDFKTVQLHEVVIVPACLKTAY